eukprot:320949-Pleurochrysis_carterae.AAC.2
MKGLHTVCIIMDQMRRSLTSEELDVEYEQQWRARRAQSRSALWLSPKRESRQGRVCARVCMGVGVRELDWALGTGPGTSAVGVAAGGRSRLQRRVCQHPLEHARVLRTHQPHARRTKGRAAALAARDARDGVWSAQRERGESSPCVTAARPLLAEAMPGQAEDRQAGLGVQVASG